ncbi:hypothetical protein DXC51_17485 [Eisenbergiella massiliensis]|uniref:Uncharacterized protein n=1 Tax=Eisenbergiella massiliensis TaxID=1720294 RepID=A0A3E3I1D3_9FIRM|nr:hypothetical protein DXC51_17485 [Eisenbergiella massiliensis]
METSRLRIHPPFVRAGCGRASFSRAGGACFQFQSQKQGVSNRSPIPGICQRGQNSSAAALEAAAREKVLRPAASSDRPLRAAEARPWGSVRNISVFSNGAENTPPPAREKEARPQPARAKGGWNRNRDVSPLHININRSEKDK